MPHTNYKPSKQLSKDFVAVLQQSPGLSTADFAKALGIHDTTFSRASNVLVKRGRIIRKRVGHGYQYYLPEEKKAETVQLMIPSDIRPADIVELAELDALREELKSLRAEASDLRAFKERALLLHPDLDVDPIVLEARKIASLALLDVGNREGGDNVLFGLADDTPIVKATVEALQRAQGRE
jgi:DNA-binding MarR family transcriptional regulator